MFQFREIAFQWPMLLWLLLIVPPLILMYARLLARQRRVAHRFGTLTISGAGKKPG